MRLVFFLLASSSWLACDHMISIDARCDKLCLATPGPTLPGFDQRLPLAADAAANDDGQAIDAAVVDGPLSDAAEARVGSFDASSDISLDGAIEQPPDIGPDASSEQGAGVSSGIIQWFAEVPFDEAMKQLPSAAFDLSLNVRISSLHLTSTTDLSFVDTVDIFLERPKTRLDGGIPVADSGTEPNDDGGLRSSPCGIGSAPLLVASFRRTDVSSSGPDLDLTLSNRDLNLAACMKDAPALFDVRMGIIPTAYPASDVPLVLGSCIAVATHATFP